VLVAETIEKSLLDLDFAALTPRAFTPSAAAWEGQVLCLLVLDRFSTARRKTATETTTTATPRRDA
jgi:hypothetical protein